MTRLPRRGLLWLLDYTYVAWWQAHGLLFRSDETAYLDPDAGGQPVVLLPGIYERWQFMRPVADLLHDRGHPVHVVARLRWNTSPVDASAQLVADYLEEHDLRGVLLVAHSKGGLIGKSVMLHEEAGRRVDRMVAIATPFSGSVYARLFLLPAVRALSPRDRTLRSLAEQLEVNSRITSIWGAFDPHIPGGSHLEGATNVRLRTSGHFRILGRPELLDAVARATPTR
ncbi:MULTISPECIES: esterase/lipase family protein [unclassified Ornithinimicrobium]|uniref:esterase/lipase family protein n=1 Tax=unclassified Ornithinimicrobium TaxID=2615080 RepID=UPI0038520D3E